MCHRALAQARYRLTLLLVVVLFVFAGCNNPTAKVSAALEATVHDDAESLAKLIKSGVSVDTYDQDYHASLLMWSLKAYATNSFYYLLNAGADVTLTDKAGNNALAYCTSLKPFGQRAAQSLVERGANINNSNSNGWTPLAKAITADNLELAEYLIKQGAGIEIDTSASESLLELAAAYGSPQGVDLVVKYIEEQGMDISKDHEKAISFALLDPLHCERKMKALLSAGCEIDAQDSSGITPLILAAKRGQIDAVKYLLALGADHSLKDDTGRTARDWAIEKNNHHIVDVLNEEASKRRNGTVGVQQ